MNGQPLRARVVKRIVVLLASGGLVVSAAACGGAEAKAPDVMKTAEPPEREPASIEEAQQRIASAKAELAGGRPRAAGDSYARQPGTDADSPTPAEPAPAPPQSTTPAESPLQQRPSTSTSSESAPAKATRNVDGRCGSPCRALTSMRRAVTALCRMTGAEDARCLDAKHTLADSESRVAPCSCRE